jgi:hypothetical protein
MSRGFAFVRIGLISFFLQQDSFLLLPHRSRAVLKQSYTCIKPLLNIAMRCACVALADPGLAQLASALAPSLSGGEQQRAAG